MAFDWNVPAAWLAAAFTGATAYLMWRQGRPAPPAVEWEQCGDMPREGERLLRVTIRNNDRHAALRLGDIECPAPAENAAEYRERRHGEDPIPPGGGSATWIVSMTGPHIRGGIATHLDFVLINAATRKPTTVRVQLYP